MTTSTPLRAAGGAEGAPDPSPTRPPAAFPRRLPARGWRWLRRMSTALHLLLAIAVATILAGLLPQERTAAATVAHWRAGTAGPGRGTTALLDALGLLDVLGSWWFQCLAGLLLLSLVACLVPRTGALRRGARRPPPAGRCLDDLGHCAVLASALAPEEALAVVARTLRRRRFRVRLVPPAGAPAGRARVAAERVRGREIASVTFHASILLLLGAVAVGRLLGFTGQIDLTEGEAFAETAIAYDRVASGPGWSSADHRGFRVDLDAFRVTEHPDGTPAAHVATVRVDDGAPVEVAVNHPLRHAGMRVHLARWGLAPHVTVRDAVTGAALAGESVHLVTAGPLAWAGLLVVDPGGPGRDPVVLDLVLLPDARLGEDGRPTAVGTGGEPLLLATAYAGPGVLRDDGQRREIDRSRPSLGATATLVAGTPAVVADRYEVTFTEPARWAGFQVSRVPWTPVAFGAAVLLLVGLVGSLFAYPVRLWAEARAVPGGSEVVVAGVARHRPEAFDAAFPRHVRALRRAVSRNRPTG